MRTPLRGVALAGGALSVLFGCGKELAAVPASAGPAAPAAVTGPLAEKTAAAIGKARDFLLKSQQVDGGWTDPGYTAIVTTALLRVTPGATRATQPAIWKGLESLVLFQKPDGAVFDKGNANYITSVALMAWLESKDSTFAEPARRAAAYVGDAILDEKEGATPEGNVHYGGSGYEKRLGKEGELYADLSNTSYALEALAQAKAAGLPVDEKAMAAAVRFLQRCQHRTESNDQGWASDDPKVAGGFVYHPKESKAGEIEIGGKKVLLPYGSMTYAGIKSFIYARVSKDDPRVKAAVDWIRSHYTLEQNPGFDITRDLAMGQQGLYYYFDTFAKCHAAIGEDRFTDAKGVAHDWRAEVAEALLPRQRADGSWVNEKEGRWFEGNPYLATSYALLALAYCVPGK